MRPTASTGTGCPPDFPTRSGPCGAIPLPVVSAFLPETPSTGSAKQWVPYSSQEGSRNENVLQGSHRRPGADRVDRGTTGRIRRRWAGRKRRRTATGRSSAAGRRRAPGRVRLLGGPDEGAGAARRRGRPGGRERRKGLRGRRGV